jgi:hypothetical protein
VVQLDGSLGAIWAHANFGQPLFNIHGLAIDPGSAGSVYAGDPDGVFATFSLTRWKQPARRSAAPPDIIKPVHA